MENEFDYFLLIAEEMNITKAAKRAYTSQQALSKYLTTLEKRYGVLLFNRKPRLSLTPAGAVLLRHAQQIKQMTNVLYNEIDSIKLGQERQLRVGGGSGRGMSIFPIVLNDFWKSYPDVTVQLYGNTTAALRKMLLDGELDVVLGVSPAPSAQLDITDVYQEGIYLVITDHMLREYFPDDYPQCKERFQENVDLREFAHVPFAMGRNTVEINRKIFNYLEQEGVELQYRCVSGSNELNLQLCNSTACFCLGFLQPYISTLNRALAGRNEIYAFPIRKLVDCNTLTIMQRASAKRTDYIDHFVTLLTDYLMNGESTYGESSRPFLYK